MWNNRRSFVILSLVVTMTVLAVGDRHALGDLSLSGGGLELKSEGGTGNASNLAAGKRPFAKDCHPAHAIGGLTDDKYGNANSWLAHSADSYAGVVLSATPVSLNVVAFGRDNRPSGAYKDRSEGTFTLQYTSEPLDPGKDPPANTRWTTIGTLTYGSAGGANYANPHLRHVYAFDTVQATAFLIRVRTPDNRADLHVAIDELELYEVQPAEEAGPRPEMELTGNGVAIEDGDTTPHASDFTFLGAVRPGQTIARTFTIKNTGARPLNLGGSPRVAVSGAYAAMFTVTAQPSSPVAAGGSTTFQVTFKPTQLGSPSATLSIANDDSDESPYDFAIRGLCSGVVLAGGGLKLLQEGRSFRPGNRARGKPTFTSTTRLGSAAAMVDGRYGAPSSWLASSTICTVDIMLGGNRIPINRVAFGRDNRTSGGFTNRSAGTFQLQYTRALLDPTKPPPANTPWQTIGTIRYGGAGGANFSRPYLRHLYSFDTVWASAFRIYASAAISGADHTLAFDEIELYGEGLPAPDIQVIGNGAEIADGDATPALSDHTHFGDAARSGGSAVRMFAIRNTGKDPLKLTGTPAVAFTGSHAAEFRLTTPPATTIQAGGSTTFQVTFRPAYAGQRSALLWIATDDPDENPYNFVVRGNGIETPEIDVRGNGVIIADGDTTPAAADHTDFGSTTVDAGTVVRMFRILNIGKGQLSFRGLSVTPADAGFRITRYPPSGPVAPRQWVELHVEFAPTTPGPRTATVRIASNDADEAEYDFSIRGTGVALPDIHVTGNGVAILDGDRTPAAADHTDFATVRRVSGSTVRTFTVQNTGTADLTLGALRVRVGAHDSAEFKVTTPPAATVGPGESTTFQITFDPAAPVNYAAVVVLASNDPDENPYDFLVRGSGVDHAEIGISGNGTAIADGDSTPDSRDHTDFGPHVVGSRFVRSFVIENTGQDPLLLPASPRVRVSGPHASDFVVTGQPPQEVAAGRSASFEVTFTPQATGVRTATITVVNKDVDEAFYDFAVRGRGAAPEIAISGNGAQIADGDTTPRAADHTDFGTLPVTGGKVRRTFVISNSGDVPLTLGGSPRVTVSGPQAAEFAVTAQPASPVAPGRSTTFEITFDAAGFGERTATVSLICDDADESPYDFVIRGTAAAPEIAIVGNGAGIADGDTSPAEADHTHFGSTGITFGSVVRTFEIRNTGAAPLTLGGSPRVAVSGPHAADFKVTGQPASPIAPGGSTTFQVTFDAAGFGQRTAILRVASDDVDESSYDFAVRGTGIGVLISRGVSLLEEGGTFAPGNLATGKHVSATKSHASHSVGGLTDGKYGNSHSWLGTSKLCHAAIVLGANMHPVNRVAFGRDNRASGAEDDRYRGTYSLEYTKRIPAQAGDWTRIGVVVYGAPSEGKYSSPHRRHVYGFETVWAKAFRIVTDAPTASAADFIAIDEIELYGVGLPSPEITVIGKGVSIADGDTTPSAADHTEFGYVDVNRGGAVRNFGIKNTGPDPLVLSSSGPRVAVAGAHRADFRVTEQPASPIAPGAFTVFKVLFDPTAVGVRTAELVIFNNDKDGNPHNFLVRGSGVPSGPEIVVWSENKEIMDGDTTPSVDDRTDFEKRPAHGGARTVNQLRSWLIRNIGSQPLTVRVGIGGDHAGDFRVVTPPTSPILTGRSVPFAVEFHPTDIGLRRARVEIATNDRDENPFDFAIQGTGTGVAMSAGLTLIREGRGLRPEPGNLARGKAAFANDVFDHSNHSIRGVTDGRYGNRGSWLANGQRGHVGVMVGGANLRPINRVAFGRDDSSEGFEDRCQGTYTLEYTNRLLDPTKPPPPETRWRTIGVLKYGARSVTPFIHPRYRHLYSFETVWASAFRIIVEAPAPGVDHYIAIAEIELYGEGLPEPEIELLGGGQQIVDGSLSASPVNQTDFGEAAVNGGTVERRFTINNKGKDPLTFSAPISVTGSGAAEFAVTSIPRVIAAGGSATFGVRFDPAGPGKRVARIMLFCNDADESPFDFVVRGTGK